MEGPDLVISRRSVVLTCGVALACRSTGGGERTQTAPSVSGPPASPATPGPAVSPPSPAAGIAPDAALPAASARPGAASAAAPSPTAMPVPLPWRVLVVGDSLSDPRVGGGGYVTRALHGCPDVEVVNLARGGWMVNQMRRRLEQEAQRGLGRATHLVVFGGVNDVYSDESAGRTPEKITADLAAIYAIGRSLGARVVALTIAPWGGFSRYYNPRRAQATRRVNDWIRAQLGENHVQAVVDASTLLACGDAERLCADYEAPFRDGLHFGPEGHAVLGAALSPAFGRCG